jgi:hypothetical protein
MKPFPTMVGWSMSSDKYPHPQDRAETIEAQDSACRSTGTTNKIEKEQPTRSNAVLILANTRKEVVVSTTPVLLTQIPFNSLLFAASPRLFVKLEL